MSWPSRLDRFMQTRTLYYGYCIWCGWEGREHRRDADAVREIEEHLRTGPHQRNDKQYDRPLASHPEGER